MTERLVVIDPNVRIAGNHTFTFLDYEDSDDLLPGMKVTAVEPESGMRFPARVIRVHSWSKGDDHDMYMELEVSWSEVKVTDE